MSCDILGRLSGVMFFGVSVPAHDVAVSRRCVEVSEDIIDRVLENSVVILRCSFSSVVALIDFAFAVFFCGCVGVFNACHWTNVDGVINFILHDVDDPESDAYD